MAAIDEVEQHFAESSEIALALIRAGLSRPQRDTAALSMIFLALFCADASRQRWAQAAESLADLPDSEERYQRQQDTLLRLARLMQARAAMPAGTGDDALTAWTASMRRLHAALADAPAAAQIMNVDAPVARKRIMNICAHLACNRLGLSLAEERHLRYLASRTVSAMADAG